MKCRTTGAVRSTGAGSGPAAFSELQLRETTAPTTAAAPERDWGRERRTIPPFRLMEGIAGHSPQSPPVKIGHEVEHRLYQLVSIEQGLIVVVRTRDDHEALLHRKRLVQASALFRRDDAVAITGDHERRTFHASGAVERWISIPQ